MSEGNVPSRSHDADSLANAQGQLPLQPDGQSDTDGWETVSILGMPPLNAPVPVKSPTSSTAADGPDKTAELQTRLVDLSQCNDVLLSRVHQLEEALERAQQALQQEVERSQRLTDEDKVAAAQTRSMAQLLSELDDVKAALKRQNLLAETLSVQLKSAEERAHRLEQECNILRKRKTERAKQLQVAEDTCADLRSRLQRQQQYTLQFKSALEKCLDTAVFQHTSHRIEHELTQNSEAAAEASNASSHNIGMPRSESIRPWSANPAQAPTDPQLHSLLRTPIEPSSPCPLEDPQSLIAPSLQVAGNSDAEANLSTADPLPDRATPGTIDAAAEQQLWQDVERVIENTVNDPALIETETDGVNQSPKTLAVTAAGPIETDPSEGDPSEGDPSEAQFTEPIPWGTPVETTPSVEPLAGEDKDSEVISGATDYEPAFQSVSTATPDMTPEPASSQPHVSSIPALDAMHSGQTSPSPLVHPLRSAPRKRKSLSAVELPNFPPLPKVPAE